MIVSDIIYGHYDSANTSSFSHALGHDYEPQDIIRRDRPALLKTGMPLTATDYLPTKACNLPKSGVPSPVT